MPRADLPSVVSRIIGQFLNRQRRSGSFPARRACVHPILRLPTILLAVAGYPMERRPNPLPSLPSLEHQFQTYSLNTLRSTSSTWMMPSAKPAAEAPRSASAPQSSPLVTPIKKSYQRQRSQLIFTELYTDGKAPIKRKRMRRPKPAAGQEAAKEAPKEAPADTKAAEPTATKATSDNNKMAIGFLCSAQGQSVKK